jgi:hypothetical protein
MATLIVSHSPTEFQICQTRPSSIENTDIFKTTLATAKFIHLFAPKRPNCIFCNYTYMGYFHLNVGTNGVARVVVPLNVHEVTAACAAVAAAAARAGHSLVRLLLPLGHVVRRFVARGGRLRFGLFLLLHPFVLCPPVLEPNFHLRTQRQDIFNGYLKSNL